MAISSPRYGLTRSGRGWYKRVGRGAAPRWIVSLRLCPTPADADAYFEEHFQAFTTDAEPRLGCRLRAAVDAFILHKRQSRLHPGTVADYVDTGVRLLRAVDGETDVADVTPAHLEAFKAQLAGLGAPRRQKHIINARTFTKWVAARFKAGWTVADLPVVTKREMRREKVRRVPFTPNQVRRLIRYGTDRQQLMVLLGLNLAIGPDEMCHLTGADLAGADFTRPRSKTGIVRQVPIWPEVKKLLGKGKGRVFGTATPAVLIRSFRRLCDRACVPPLGLYHLRRTTRTVADAFGDQRATALLMGRELPDTDSVYVLTVGRERLVAMMDHVKRALRVGQALAARRRDAKVYGLAGRLARRATTGRSSHRSRGASSGSRARRDGRG